jgi:plasmid stabilization system protein ParE
MAYRVIWSAKAVEDVEAIATYIVRDSPSYTAAVVYKILEATRLLSQDPCGSAIVESLDGQFREILAYTYRIVYHLQGDTVTVVAIVHTKHLLSF